MPHVPRNSAVPKIKEVLSTTSTPIVKKPLPPHLQSPASLPPGHPAAAQLQAMQSAQQAAAPAPTEERDPNYLSISLPSQFYWYSFKSLSIRTLQGSHISKISRAEKESSLRYLVEAISATLAPGVSAFDLQPADFYYLMYWQRLNSFLKNPMLIEVVCQNEDHRDEVALGIKGEDGEYLRDENNQIVKKPLESLNIKEYLTRTTLDVKDFVVPDLTQFAELKEFCGLGYETMADVVETTERIVEADDGDPEYAFKAGRAAFIEKRPGQMTLAERIAVFESMDPDMIILLDKYIDAITDFGVSESANIRCKECGASTRVSISFDALTFLPSGR